MSDEVTDSGTERVIPVLGDGKSVMGTASNPLHVTWGNDVSFDQVNEALAVADAAIDLNGQSLTGVDDLAVGGAQTIGETLGVTGVSTLASAVITGAATVGTTLGVTGDVTAAGGFRREVGPFFVTTAADQTAVGMKYGDTVSQAWVAHRAGSVTGVSGFVDAAVTGAGKSIKVRVYKALAADPTSFTLLNAALDLNFTQAGGERKASVNVAKDTYAFAAGDMLLTVYTTDTITNTPKVVVNLEVEC